jgi:tripartite ATP-independent transporter DctM subunit
MGFMILALFLVFFLLGFPVVYAILIPSVMYVLIEGFPIGLLGQRITYSLDSFPLVAVPIFIFVGNLMNQSGITDRIFHFANTLVGRAPGGLAQVNIFSSLIFSGMSGASLADVGGLGKIEIEAMKKRGYGAPFSAAVTASSAVVGPIFPPSIPLIVYGSVTSVSIVQLLLAGIVPALICTALLMITAAILAIKHDMPRAPRLPTASELYKSFIPALPALLAPALMISGMLLGLFTPTEAAAVTAAYVLVVSSIFYRELTWPHLINSMMATLKTTSAILIIVAAASMFVGSYLLSRFHSSSLPSYCRYPKIH